MYRGVYQSAVTLAMILAFYAGDVWLIHRFDPARAQGSSRSWTWTLFSALMALVVVIQPILLPALGFYTDAAWGRLAQGVGLALIAVGLALHWWARWHLKQFYGERVEYQQGQVLIQDGPYAYVRHPIYTSFFLCIVGLLLVNPALTTLAVTLYFFWDFPRTARKEEELLIEKLAGYEQYAARTPRYVPDPRRWIGSRR
jgi:protein-S-isoprenylcysteine O-methyltransferase Ste14